MDKLSIDVGAEDFQERVIQASFRVPVLVDFWAEWCAPCRTLGPVLEKLAADYGGRFVLAKINSDHHRELAAQLGVRGIPSIKAFVNGKLVDEFTGVQPEAKIRNFIDALLPSPAEPLRIAAEEARARGEADVARSLLLDAELLDPANEAVQLDHAEVCIDLNDTDTARAILDALEHKARDVDRMQALLARLKLATERTAADPAELRARIEVNADDFDARLQLANALALAHDYRLALEQLLEIVRRDRKWRDEAARKAMLDIFNLLARDPRHEMLLREFRVQLARTLN